MSSLEPFRDLDPSSTPSIAPPPDTDSPNSSDQIPLSTLLCYGCLLILEGVQLQDAWKLGAGNAGPLLLPAYVGDAARERWSSEKLLGVRVRSEEEMAAVVQDFLLD